MGFGKGRPIQPVRITNPGVTGFGTTFTGIDGAPFALSVVAATIEITPNTATKANLTVFASFDVLAERVVCSVLHEGKAKAVRRIEFADGTEWVGG